MADGDVVLDRNFEVDAQEGTRAELFAVEDSSYPGGYYYRFQYYAPEEGEQILRYDNAHDSDVGPHHRHEGDDVAGIEFDGLQDHVARFRQEVLQINARR
ncbi:DUF6516 family protein (plasmid) [Natrinema thermotolerans]|uniref:DUF6516 family protein n=1 Tax=Natrinema thermotolerans TaxID=121872 RepID=A0AAF0T4E0_9EURY|nr:DUF6516 family protein [Natrinema thermotolerans]QCC57307.1 hypothetical protein DVR14_01105 [Natrinema thermotolerans]WMT10352.1 DUF6516 family protein [Natrinema thermotolerans]